MWIVGRIQPVKHLHGFTISLLLLVSVGPSMPGSEVMTLYMTNRVICAFRSGGEKGGEYQLQHILPGDEMFVKSYFDGLEGPVFTKAELANKIDLHHLRAVQAQKAYRYYSELLRRNPEYRAQLEAEIKARWQLYNKRRWKQHEFEGTYKLRGANRQLAQKLGKPTEYDRLAVMATSVFHLSHWRCDVTISNYLLAY